MTIKSFSIAIAALLLFAPTAKAIDPMEQLSTSKTTAPAQQPRQQKVAPRPPREEEPAAPAAQSGDFVVNIQRNVIWLVNAETFRLNGARARAWITVVYRESNTDSKYYKQLSEIDCANMTVTDLNVTFYDRVGQVVQSTSKPSSDVLVPGSVAYASSKRICDFAGVWTGTAILPPFDPVSFAETYWSQLGASDIDTNDERGRYWFIGVPNETTDAWLSRDADIYRVRPSENYITVSIVKKFPDAESVIRTRYMIDCTDRTYKWIAQHRFSGKNGENVLAGGVTTEGFAKGWNNASPNSMSEAVVNGVCTGTKLSTATGWKPAMMGFDLWTAAWSLAFTER